MISRRDLVSSAALWALASSAARGATYPTKPIRLVVPNAAGGGMDFLARTVAGEVSKALGQPLIVDNKAGAATAVGAADVARSTGDGYTLLIADNGTLVFNPLLYSKLTYNPSTDFTPISLLAQFPMILVVGPSVEQKSASALIDFAKQNPGLLTFASPGVGGPHHLAMELLKKSAGLQMVHVPYRGAAPAIQDVAAGQAAMMMVDLAAGSAMIKAGKVRALAVANAQRLPQMPNVPTFAELGFDAVRAAASVGVVVPSSTPVEITASLEQHFVSALKAPAVQARMIDFGVEPVGSTSAQYADILKRERVTWGKIIRELNITLD